MNILRQRGAIPPVVPSPSPTPSPLSSPTPSIPPSPSINGFSGSGWGSNIPRPLFSTPRQPVYPPRYTPQYGSSSSSTIWSSSPAPPSSSYPLSVVLAPPSSLSLQHHP